MSLDFLIPFLVYHNFKISYRTQQKLFSDMDKNQNFVYQKACPYGQNEE